MARNKKRGSYVCVDGLINIKTYISEHKHSKFHSTKSLQLLSMVKALGGKPLLENVVSQQFLHVGCHRQALVCAQMIQLVISELKLEAQLLD